MLCIGKTPVTQNALWDLWKTRIFPLREIALGSGLREAETRVGLAGLRTSSEAKPPSAKHGGRPGDNEADRGTPTLGTLVWLDAVASQSSAPDQCECLGPATDR